MLKYPRFAQLPSTSRRLASQRNAFGHHAENATLLSQDHPEYDVEVILPVGIPNFG